MTAKSDVLADEGERVFSSPEAYELIAQHYDEQLNPLLALEERTITPLLPSVAGKCVLDVGCGTGRWLARLAEHGPRVLWGIDASSEMLRLAAAKLGNAALLSVAQGTDLPITTGAADVVICSFVASYIEDVSALALEVRRVCRAGATVLLTDLHPETARKLDWKRAFRTGEQEVVLKTWSHSREKLVAPFRDEGFEIEFELQPEFGEPERAIFDAAGKTNEFDRASGEPALLVLGFKPKARVTSARGPVNSPRLTGARVALDTHTAVETELEVQDDRIDSIRTSGQTDMRADHVLDLSGHLLLPGLINAHDHLEFALFPRLGNRVYANAHEWALDIYRPDEEPIRSHRMIAKSIRLWWGGIRNLLSGVTTVCHHNEYAPVFDDHFPVRVLRQYGWAHSLAFEENMQVLAEALSSDAPFFVHLGEGTDAEAEEELWELDRLGLLTSRTVLIHALAIGQKGLDLVRSRGASIVWCPSSNQFLFGRTLDGQFIDACPSIALGSDSPLTSAGDLLDEIRTARNCGVSAAKIYDLVTSSGARVLGLSEGEGAIRPRGMADLVAIQDRGLSPAEALVNANYRDVELVVSAGEIKLASERMKARLNESQVRHLSAIRVEDNLRWIAAPVDELLAAAESVLGPDIRLGGRRVSRA